MSVASEINRIKTAVADAYSTLEEKGATMPVVENVANLADTIDQLSPQELSTRLNGEYSNTMGYSPININVPARAIVPTHCDRNYKWHLPDGWEDIESVPIDEDESVVYFLLDCKMYEHTFFRARVYGSGLKWSYGHVNNGVYTAVSAESTLSSGGYAAMQELDQLDEDQIVVKIYGTSITQVTPYANTGTYAFTYYYNPILMRYGNLPKVTGICKMSNYSIESDNIMNYFRDSTGKSISLSEHYSGSYQLRRLVMDGWNLKGQNITSVSSMFASCYCLCDAPDLIDLSGIVTSTTTGVSSMFSSCYCLNSKIDVSNWDFSGCKGSMGSIFSGCYNVPDIIGTDTWVGCDKVTTVSSLFANCYNLDASIDTSTWGLTDTVKSVASMFTYCQKLRDVKLAVDLSNVTSCDNMFSYCSALESVDFTDVVPITDKCTAVSSLFRNCYSLQHHPSFAGWDFTNASIAAMFCYDVSLEELDFTGATPSTVNFSDSSSAYPHLLCIKLKKIDYRGAFESYSQCTSTYMHSALATINTPYIVDYQLPNGLCKAVTANAALLSHDSLLNIINALDDLTGKTALKLTLGTINLSKLTAEEKAIATGKNWTLA